MASVLTEAERALPWRMWLKRDRIIISLIILDLLLIVLFAIGEPRFATWTNFGNIARQGAPILVIASGATLVMIAGGVDLSIGSNVSFVSTITAMAVLAFGFVPGVLIGLAVGCLVGALNGVLIAKFRIPPFIVTLGTLSLLAGLALEVSGGLPVQPMPPVFGWLGVAQVGVIPVMLIVGLLTAFVVGVVLRFTRFGLYTYAIGGDEETARRVGVNIERHKVLIYTLSGLLSALGGILLSSRVRSGQPVLGLGMELEVIAAVLVGGVRLGGGAGSMVGVFLGVLLLSLIANGLDLFNVSSFYQQIIVGLIIIGAAISRIERKPV